MQTNINNLSAEEMKNFASGIASDECKTSENTGHFVLNNLTESLCPAFASETREEVSYGTFKHDTYYSASCETTRGVNILLPAGYSADKQYPVLYMLHGIFGNEYSFSEDNDNGVRNIVANMAFDGIIPEMIVVCPDMYATKDPSLKPGFSAEQVVPYDYFGYDLVNDLMPYIESHYSALTGRDNTLLAGFSMGGRETLYITYLFPEHFGYVSSISAAPGLTPGKDWAMIHPGTIKEEELKFAEDAIVPNVLLVCCGTKDSVVGTFPKSYHEIMVKNKMKHTWFEVADADHNNVAIKSGLYNLYKAYAFDKKTNA